MTGPLSDQAKPDEIALWEAIQDGTWPRHAGSRLGIPPKRTIALCHKWTRRGIYNYGVSADMGWVERWALLENILRDIPPDVPRDRAPRNYVEQRALLDDSLRDIPPAPCCDLHNRNCEPPSELCCEHCTEAAHPGHRDGSACIAPDLSPNSPTQPVARSDR